ncbi:hypothetical protein [Alicyclobacillus dauci]|uniref:Uncharacterized protein n=1 Tax=Alicyclobacillus dauci TaxID=1475485 RepID=A0ABY6Z9T5_9BACL|nr:hypothetical protein [Alicyclobacillus dauci]WAH39475.1 hypothetical protein NZD86_24200 [Alicyclobacillus dauci]WAH39535.1 hypothetical protein NZD86_23900 [Alicyclobacillus dauci]
MMGMGDKVSDLFGILSFLSFVSLILGLIKPSLVLHWGNHRTRGRAALTYIGAIVVFAILSGVTSGNSKPTTPASAPATNDTSGSSNTTSTVVSNGSSSSNTTVTTSKPKATTKKSAPATTSTPKSTSTPDATAQLAFLSSFPALDSSGSISVSQQSTDYVSQHPQWFPAASGDSSYSKAINHALTIPMIMKDPSSYATTLYQNTGTVTEIHQYHNPDYAMVQVVVDSGSEAGAEAIVMYEGSTGSIVQNSQVQFVGLPVTEWDFSNVSGGTTQSVLFDGVSLKQLS